MQKIILASQSPRRKMLMEWAGIEFDVIVQATDENFPPDLKVEEVPVYIARNKAKAIDRKDAIVVAADTIVVLGTEIIGKPKDRDDALDILSRLSGNTHRVITGVVIAADGKERAFADITEVEFHSLLPREISYYVDKCQPYDKAGAYAIQEWIGVTGVKKITGDFYNVMGLPISRVVKILQEFR